MFVDYVTEEKRERVKNLNVIDLSSIELEDIYALFIMSIRNYDNLNISFKNYENDRICLFKENNLWSVSYASNGKNSSVYYFTDIYEAFLMVLKFGCCLDRKIEFYDLISDGFTKEELDEFKLYLSGTEEKEKEEYKNKMNKKINGLSRTMNPNNVDSQM